jgi:6-phosphogluconolactonase
MSETGGAKVIVAQGPEQAASTGAKVFAGAASEAISQRGSFRVAFSGGKTPRRLYEKLAEDSLLTEVDWAHVQIFFSDERFVPAHSPDSNYNTAKALLSRITIPDRFVHRVATENVTPTQSAALYEEGMRRVFEVALTEIPEFDLIMLGLGADGHTASLFPGTDALNVTEELVVANLVPKLDSWRITFTYPLINAARKVLFLVEGEDKSEISARTLAGDSELPAARVRPRGGEVVWIMDRAASSKLSPTTGSFLPQETDDQTQEGLPA